MHHKRWKLTLYKKCRILSREYIDSAQTDRTLVNNARPSECNFCASIGNASLILSRQLSIDHMYARALPSPSPLYGISSLKQARFCNYSWCSWYISADICAFQLVRACMRLNMRVCVIFRMYYACMLVSMRECMCV